MGDRDTARSAAEIIPGVAPMNALQNFIGGIQRSMTSQPTPQSRAIEARRTAEMRRARLANQLQSDAQRAGRARLSQNEVDAHLRTMGY